MKKTMCTLLALLLVLSLAVPALGTQAGSASEGPACYEDISQWVSVTSWEELAAGLSAEEDCCLRLDRDFEGRTEQLGSHSPGESVTVRVAGTKVLDLNGHTVTYNNNQNTTDNNYAGQHFVYTNGSFRESSLFYVPAGADLTILDSQSSGRIHYDGYYVGSDTMTDHYGLHEESPYKVFEVSGTLTVNGGFTEAGGERKQWIRAPYNDGYAYQELPGCAVVVKEGGHLYRQRRQI